MRQPAPSRRPHAAGLLILAVAVAVAAAPAQAADPFYEQRLREGAAALERGDHGAAVKALRLAGFGLLEEETRLAESLGLLALAYAGAGDTANFESTFQRLIDLEDRFGAYSAADLSPAIRGRLEEAAVTLLPSELLLDRPGFSQLAEKKLAQEIARLPPRQRRERLAQQLEAQPDSAQWAILLARLEIEQGRFDEAAAAASRAIASQPDDPAAWCARGIANARRQACATAVEDLGRCDRTSSDLPIAHAMLSCLAELESWQPAEQFLAGLPPAIAGDRTIRKLQRRVEKRSAEAARAAAQAAAAEAARIAAEQEAAAQPAPTEIAAGEPDEAPATSPSEPPAGTQTPDEATATPAATTELTAADRAALTSARQALATARVANDLEAPLSQAAEVAQRNPDSQEAQYLAAEIAYRMRRWTEAVRFFSRGGEPPAERPELLFYLSVALWESGNRETARTVLEKALPRLRRTPFVESYVRTISGE